MNLRENLIIIIYNLKEINRENINKTRVNFRDKIKLNIDTMIKETFQNNKDMYKEDEFVISK